MNNLIQFPGNPIFSPEIERIANALHSGGLAFGVIENKPGGHSLTFEILRVPATAEAFEAMHALHDRFVHDADLRDELCSYCLQLGCYYLEAGSIDTTGKGA